MALLYKYYLTLPSDIRKYFSLFLITAVAVVFISMFISVIENCIFFNGCKFLFWKKKLTWLDLTCWTSKRLPFFRVVGPMSVLVENRKKNGKIHHLDLQKKTGKQWYVKWFIHKYCNLSVFFFMYRSAFYDMYNLRYYYLRQFAKSRIFHPRRYGRNFRASHHFSFRWQIWVDWI